MQNFRVIYKCLREWVILRDDKTISLVNMYRYFLKIKLPLKRWNYKIHTIFLLLHLIRLITNSVTINKNNKNTNVYFRIVFVYMGIYLINSESFIISQIANKRSSKIIVCSWYKCHSKNELRYLFRIYENFRDSYKFIRRFSRLSIASTVLQNV